MKTSNTEAEAVLEYLQKNHRVISFAAEDFADLEPLVDDLCGKEIFLCGENHGVLTNEKLRLRFLKFCKEKTNFKYYLWELPLSTAYFLNKYLETGDRRILWEVYEPFKNTYAWNQESFNHLVWLYEYNQGLAEKDRIKIVGIDIEHQRENALKYLAAAAEKEKAPWAGALKSFLAEADFNKKAVTDLCRSLSFNSELDFQSRLVIQNLLAGYEAYDSANFNDARDRQMHKNFQALYNKLPAGKYFGQMGLSHVFQRKTPNINWFASLLNQGSLRGKILSICYLYADCKYLYPTQIKDYRSEITTLNEKAAYFKAFKAEEATIFKLNATHSPFAEKMYWPIEHRVPSGGVTLNYFQYLVLIKNAPAATPLQRP